MAGTRHHDIPRFLLRGFASHTVGDEAFAWVYREGRSPYNTNIANIGVEGHFYTFDGRSDVDDAITDAEGPFASAVAELRASRRTAAAQVALLSRLVAHLEVRTRQLRANFERLADIMLARTLEFLDDRDAFARFVLGQFERAPETILGPLRNEIRARGIPDVPTEALISLVRPQVPELVAAMLPGLAAQFSEVMRRMRGGRPGALREAARHAQLRALGKAAAPEKKVAKYGSLVYEVLQTPEPLPLGDSAVFFEVGEERKFKTFASTDDTLLAAYLPLEPGLILCGRLDGFQPDLHVLPSAVVKCSREYFVAHDILASFDDLQHHLSDLAVIIDEETIYRLLAEAFGP